MKITKQTSAFTLVELIVVIVILSILATIAFLSFSSQSSMARDSTRMADITNIAKWVSIFNATSWKYPTPDRAVQLMSWSVILGYQWECWDSIIREIKWSEDWFRDPGDNVFYTYNTSVNRTRFEVMAFLENKNSIVFNINPFSEMVNIYATEYDNRFPYVKWDWLAVWVYQSWSTEIPLQDYLPTVSKTSVDVTTNNDWIAVYNSNSTWATAVSWDSQSVDSFIGAYVGTGSTWSSDDAAKLSIKKCVDLSDADITSLNTFVSWWKMFALKEDWNNVSMPASKDDWCNIVKIINWQWWSTLPKIFFSLNWLSGLYSSNQWITSLSTDISNLTNLKTLNLDNNSISSIPSWIGNLSNLTMLSMQNNSITSLPPQIWSLSSLNTLIVSGNHLTALPNELFNLVWLTYLNLSDNSLTSMPALVGNLVNLTDYFDLSNNSITSLPSQIWNLTKLTQFGLYWNKLTTLPPEFWNMTNLSQLILSHNEFTTLPAEMANLHSLTFLNLTDNAALWQLSTWWPFSWLFYGYTAWASQSWIPWPWSTMSIAWNWTVIVITVAP
jgi:prepilin-type N-terminal cleavage/methylation domain-containing protein